MRALTFRELRACDLCGSPVAGNTREGKTIDFRRIVVERHGLNVRAINERVGLAIQFGGNEALAEVFGSQPEASIPISARELLICSPCWCDTARLGDALAAAMEQDKGREIR